MHFIIIFINFIENTQAKDRFGNWAPAVTLCTMSIWAYRATILLNRLTFLKTLQVMAQFMFGFLN